MRSQCVTMLFIYLETDPQKDQDENTGDDALVEEVVGIYFSVPHSHCHVGHSVSRHCSMQTERISLSRNLQRNREKGIIGSNYDYLHYSSYSSYMYNLI